jgi:hypothetical protein
MSSTQRFVIVGLLAVALNIGWQRASGQRSEKSDPAGVVGRYQFEIREATGEVFLLDSASGQVWTNADVERGRLLNRLPLPNPAN